MGYRSNFFADAIQQLGTTRPTDDLLGEALTGNPFWCASPFSEVCDHAPIY